MPNGNIIEKGTEGQLQPLKLNANVFKWMGYISIQPSFSVIVAIQEKPGKWDFKTTHFMFPLYFLADLLHCRVMLLIKR